MQTHNNPELIPSELIGQSERTPATNSIHNLDNDTRQSSNANNNNNNGSRIDEIIRRESDIIQLIRQGDDLLTLTEGEGGDGADTDVDAKYLSHISPIGSPVHRERVGDMDLLRDKFDDVIKLFHNEEASKNENNDNTTTTNNNNGRGDGNTTMKDDDEDIDDKFILEDHQGKSKEFYEENDSKNGTAGVKEMIPPENFSHVVGEIYRSSFPRVENFDFLLKRLKLKSILVLIPEEYPTENLEFMNQSGIKLFQVGMSGNKEPFVNIPSNLLTNALEIVLNPENQPILIHCNRGKHRTGCLIGCIRKLQNWSLTMIFDEYRRFAFPKARALDQQFIEMYDDRVITKVARQNKWLPLQW
ncbi:similar to Saccharomyces cerevisiae YNL032W SIW14 Tyrosine phosphatase that plays a role in actin filament organization and endocytosis [Maudiozyma barnettii]|uniref:diphosphoinositol-polyphosphate diphosphatase n=1 Tax=Maudiozyma barnettii TaxID=61262 RepID=A0A8H2VCJ0_9SACH|nr:putative tyrosine protein phosphatase SIW14 [Kazachstania barnettii]CAB4252787.1 similar to Saccharomyces cerevisiae YNL032W SIW14 Tyrosine phosphatase that plays a role in actin filament organization and endocytosis [Kazachstania barnettii]CAD1780577.1 similar to Saccharomyces cerevisiae YNL032W SIW14 Tyrosine phosphatase that plays a role in actin filament organization and endocytosis [Kazachstania barnettii]